MRVGLIAGSGQFPIIFSKKAKSKGIAVYAAAFLNEADPLLKDYVEAVEWIHIGQIERIIKFFKKNDVSEAVMMGAVKKIRMFTDARPDEKAISIITGMKNTHDDGLLRAFAGVFENEGIRIRSSTFLLPDLLAPKGCWTKRKPTESENKDIDLGWRLAKQLGRLDIGQCLVVRGGSVLAVEAIDGTDATIKRGGELGEGTAVVVKICKPGQDERFDIPAAGAQTIQTMKTAGAKVLALEAGKTLVFDREDMVALADKYGITIVALDDKNDPKKINRNSSAHKQ